MAPMDPSPDSIPVLLGKGLQGTGPTGSPVASPCCSGHRGSSSPLSCFALTYVLREQRSEQHWGEG